MKHIILGFFNPLKLWRAFRYQRQQKKANRKGDDLQLNLYARILRNDMLHWGYFEDPGREPDTLSIRDFEEAQNRYAEMILDGLPPGEEPILDVGCGMGGLAAMIRQHGHRVELLSPNPRQKAYIMGKHPDWTFHHCRYEDFEPRQKYGTVINAESLQYIRLDQALDKTARLLAPGGRWIITDYFRLTSEGRNKSGHLLEDFRRMVKEQGWSVSLERDITAHVLPTIQLATLYARRFLLPLMDFGFEKLQVKKPWLYYMLRDFRTRAEQKTHKEMAGIDPEQFLREKKYMLFVLERPSA